MLFNQIGGATAEIAAVGEDLFALDTGKNHLYMFTNITKSWSKIGDAARGLIGGGKYLYALGSSHGEIWRYDPNAAEKWKEIGGPGSEFTCAGNKLFGLNPSRDALHMYNDETNSWKRIGGDTLHLYGGGNDLYATDPVHHNIWKYFIAEGKWEKVGGPGASFAGVGDDLYGLNPDRSMVYKYSGQEKKWNEIGKAATGLYGGGKQLYATGTKSGELWTYSQTTNSWSGVCSNASSFAALGDRLYVLNQNKSAVYQISNEQDTLKTYFNQIGAKRSQVSDSTKRQIIEKCSPIWIIAKGEDYTPKSYQDYKTHDIKSLDLRTDGSSNYNPWDDTRHLSKNGSENHTKFEKNLFTHNKAKLGNVSDLTAMYSRAAPTYAFYQEQENGNIWIRYFLFFGYNEVPSYYGFPNLPHIGYHFADFVHISVELKPSNNYLGYKPSRYFFSAHAGGKEYSASNTDLDFYVAKSDDPFNFTEKNFNDLSDSDPWHVGVFCAKGNHECFANAGYHGGPDTASYGSVVLPFIVGTGQQDHPSFETNSSYRLASIYAWDVSDPQLNQELMANPIEWQSFTPGALFTQWLPKTLLPNGWGGGSFDDGSFSKMWFAKGNDFPRGSHKHDDIKRPMYECGEKDEVPYLGGNDTSPSVKVPSYKIFEWGRNFAK